MVWQAPSHIKTQSNPGPLRHGVSRGIVIAFALLPCSVPILHPTLDRSGQCSAHHAQRSKSDLLCHQLPHPPPICMRHSQYQGIGPFAPCLPPYLFRAMDSTAQRSLSASHQEQEPPLHCMAFTVTDALPLDAPTATTRARSISGHSRLPSKSSTIIV